MTRVWPLPRVIWNVLLVLAAGSIGMAVGRASGHPELGSLVGAASGALAYAALELLRGVRLLNWLRNDHAGPVPRDTGFWGELGYRTERIVRHLDHEVAVERSRLQQFMTAVEASPNGVMLLDANDQIEWCSRLIADHFGIDPQRDRRQRITNLLRTPAFVVYLQSGQYDDPVVFQTARTDCTVSVWIRRYGDGMKLVLSQDVTDRERNEAMRRDFVANVSHEIRTPLTVVSGFIETMGSLPLSESERHRVIELMGQQTRRMQSLVGDLLTLAQIEGSPRPAADRWLPVQRLLGEAAAEAQALSAGRHQFVIDLGAAAQLAGNDSELHSAVANLLSNAVRYTPASGTVRLGWTVRPDGSGRIEVQDTGLGIERDQIPRLTERFYRVDGSRSRDTGGTGLGLSIVKHVVQRHGGALDVVSEPGKGSTFSITLPAARVRRNADDRAPPAHFATTGTVSAPGTVPTNVPATDPHVADRSR